jgi:uncharacterized CHY-type Zn-finger protein
MELIDVTRDVTRGWEDEEIVQITKCICGSQKEFTISIYKDDAHECPACGRRFVCRQTTKVYEVTP